MGIIQLYLYPKSILPMQDISIYPKRVERRHEGSHRCVSVKDGIQPKYFRRAMCGPYRLGGAGLTDGYSRQGADGLTHFLIHTR